METSDGHFVVGEVKEKTEAEAQYRTAVEAGRTAGIVNWAGDDGEYCGSSASGRM
jgi:hypothetical protein